MQWANGNRSQAERNLSAMPARLLVQMQTKTRKFQLTIIKRHKIVRLIYVNGNSYFRCSVRKHSLKKKHIHILCNSQTRQLDRFEEMHIICIIISRYDEKDSSHVRAIDESLDPREAKNIFSFLVLHNRFLL